MDYKIPDSEYTEEALVAVESAKAAGKIIDSYAMNGFESWKKDDASAVTEADLDSQRAIVRKVRENFPEDGLLAEEENLSEKKDRRWIIDPIDGTFNFRKGNSFYCVSIAFEVEGDQKVGVVYSPETGQEELYLAIKGEGSFLWDGNGRTRLEVTEYDRLEDSLIYKAFLDIYDGALEDNQEFFEDLSRNGAVSREGGACALEMCRVASGEADGAVHAVVNPWDFKAGELIVEEAGGTVDIRRSKYPDSHEIVSSNGSLHKELLQTVGEHFQR